MKKQLLTYCLLLISVGLYASNCDKKKECEKDRSACSKVLEKAITSEKACDDFVASSTSKEHFFTNTPVAFSAESSPNKSYNWNFGDCSTATDKKPTHLYKNAGIYLVTLETSNSNKKQEKCDHKKCDKKKCEKENGSSDQRVGAVVIYPTPEPTFKTITTSACGGTSVFLLDKTNTVLNLDKPSCISNETSCNEYTPFDSNTMRVVFEWSFNGVKKTLKETFTVKQLADGKDSLIKFQLINKDSALVTLKATLQVKSKTNGKWEAYGKGVSYALLIRAAKPLQAAFYMNAQYCLNDGFNVSAYSTGGVGQKKYAWYLNGSIVSNTSIYAANMSLPGIYGIRLEATDDAGCISTIEKNVEIMSCQQSLISGSLTYSSSCGSSPVSNERIRLHATSGKSFVELKTDNAGRFNFSATDLASLDTLALYSFSTTNKFGLSNATPRRLSDWMKLSPVKLTLNPVRKEWVINDISTDTNKFIYDMDVNGYIYTCTQTYTAANNSDILITKLDDKGKKIWDRHFDGGFKNEDYVAGMVMDNDKHVYVAGTSYHSYTSGSNYFSDSYFLLLKYDSSGALVWSKTVDLYTPSPNWVSSKENNSNALTVDAEGNIILTGYAGNAIQNSREQATIKFDVFGNILWKQKHIISNAPMQQDIPVKIMTDGENNIYTTCNAVSTNNTRQIKTTCYNKAGSLLWVKLVSSGATADDLVNDMAFDRENNIVITGQGTLNFINTFAHLIKYDTLGNELIHKAIDSQWNGTASYANNITVDAYNNIYLSGGNYFNSGSEAIISKFDASGNYLWHKTYTDSMNYYNSPANIALDANNNVYMKVSCQNPAYTYSKEKIVKWNSSGDLVWEQLIAANYSTYSSYNHAGPILDNQNAVYTDFATSSDGMTYKAGVAKLEQCDQNLTTARRGRPSKFILATNATPKKKSVTELGLFPNPSQGVFHIAAESDQTELVITDPMGRVVYNNVVGMNANEIDLSGQNNGIYYYSLTSNAKKVSSGKLIIAR